MSLLNVPMRSRSSSDVRGGNRSTDRSSFIGNGTLPGCDCLTAAISHLTCSAPRNAVGSLSATEVCDGDLEDCNGLIDDGLTSTFYEDSDSDGTPNEPAALWLSEIGLPVRPNSWEVVFARASSRCRSFGLDINISPHQLRHTFAVHMLAMLIQHRVRDAALPAGPMEGYRQILGDPLQQVQRLLGHASLTTTYIYLDHIATRADTVDAAVEDMIEAARELGADGVIGIDFDYEVLGESNGMMMVAVSGTAVRRA